MVWLPPDRGDRAAAAELLTGGSAAWSDRVSTCALVSTTLIDAAPLHDRLAVTAMECVLVVSGPFFKPTRRCVSWRR